MIILLAAYYPARARIWAKCCVSDSQRATTQYSQRSAIRSRGVHRYNANYLIARSVFDKHSRILLIIIPFVYLGRMVNRLMFRPLPFPIEIGLAQRANYSEIIRWTMYIGAKITQTILDDLSWQYYIGWINHFHRQLVDSCASPKLSTSDLYARLSGLQDVSMVQLHTLLVHKF